MQNGLCLEYFSSLLPLNAGDTSTYWLRNTTHLHTIRTNSQLYYKSFVPSVIHEWNELPLETRNSTSIFAFKRKLNSNLNAPPKYFCDGKRFWSNLSCKTKDELQFIKLLLGTNPQKLLQPRLLFLETPILSCLKNLIVTFKV